MSDEESFVILGSSPMSSLEVEGGYTESHSRTQSLQSDTPGSRFSSLKSSQITDLQNAQENEIQAHDENLIQPERSNPVITTFIKSAKNISSASLVNDSETVDSQDSRKMQFESTAAQVPDNVSNTIKTIENLKLSDQNIQPEIADPVTKMPHNIQKTKWSAVQMADSKVQQKSLDIQQQMKDSKLWSREPQYQVQEKNMPSTLEECALKSPLAQEHQSDRNITQISANSTNTICSGGENTNTKSTSNTNKTTPPLENLLASSFIMGEINAEILKTSVYSQFPSISMEACAEDVVKLQNMVTEYTQLKTTIKKANNTMKLFYENSLQCKEKMKAMEEQYITRLEGCRGEIEALRKQNEELEISFKSQIEALEIARKKDREETIQEISEKNALLENMRAQIIKLEQQQMSSFEFVAQNQGEQKNEQFDNLVITHREHKTKIKELERQLSELLASNLDFKDIEKVYIDELNCLKVNLTAAEELYKKNRLEIAQLVEVNLKRQEQINDLEKSVKELTRANEEQCERISLLEHQNELHRKDFEMEQESRQTAVKEKQQLLQDLRNLQKKNQELIEEHQKIAQRYEKKYSSVEAMHTAQITAAAAAAQSYLNNPQRPIRVSTALPSPSSAPQAAKHMCPICNKAYNSLNLLQSHVNDCIDKN